MAPSLIEKYEQIFAADPRSRIFVELAKALLERGEPERAIEVCQTGLEHHPSSILGRVIWGRALVEKGDLPGAQDQFDVAIALDPGNPYAYNLVGEALLSRQLFREALPALARAAELQPGDERLRGWLEEAHRRAQEQSRASGGGRVPSDQEVTQLHPFSKPSLSTPQERTPTPPPARAPLLTPRPTASPTLLGSPVLERARPTPQPQPAVLPSPAPTPAGPADTVPGGLPIVLPAPLPQAPPVIPQSPPPLAEMRLRDEVPRSLLAMIPGATRPSQVAATAAPAEEPSEAETREITERFEEEVRQRLLSEPEPSLPLFRRHRRLFLAAVVLAAAAAAAGVFLHLRARSQAELAATAAARARAGLARDTVGALREAANLLAEARRGSSTPELTSLAAQVAAVLATEHGDLDSRTLAESLAEKPEAGDGGLAAAYLLSKSPVLSAPAEAAILAAPPSSEPLLQALAGRILLRRGELEAGRGRLEIASRAAPPLLRAFSDLGDAALAAGDPEGALGYYGAALSAHSTHPRSVVGAAEARLALDLDLGRAKAELEAMAQDPGSAPPADLKVRLAVTTARVLTACGDPAAAAAGLARATEQLGETGELAAAAAEAHLAARAYDRAEAAAAHAVALTPKDPAARVLLARARIGRGRYAEALSTLADSDGRAVFLQRAIARYRMGQFGEARRELERTARDGRMPTEAAVWYALTDLRLGRADQARTLLEKLAASRTAPALAEVALGQALEALGRGPEAEAAYRTALERDPGAPEGHAALGELLLGRGAAAEAVPELEKSVAADPNDPEVRRALGAARLLTGQPSLARAELDAVLLAHPADLEALRLLSVAWLAEGQPREARRAADRGLARAPANAPLLLAAARAAKAQGDLVTARGLAERAVKAAGKGPESLPARALLAEIRKG